MLTDNFYIGDSKYQGLLTIVKNMNSKLLIECSEINVYWKNPELALKDNTVNPLQGEEY
jgi:hypothetical protein